MKRQIRRGVFETNSSSAHSLTIMSEEDYDKWNDETYMKDGKVYTLEQVTEIWKEEKLKDARYKKWYPRVENYIESKGYKTTETYNNNDNYYENFDESYTTKSGDKIRVFGYYGHD